MHILGPVDEDPSVIALDRPLAGIDATASGGRLVLSGATGRSGFAIAFMSVAGSTIEQVAGAVVDAAQAAEQAER